MSAETLSPIRRPHTILGVCEALGDDFGFNPLYLRVVLAAGLFFNATWVIAAYLGLGVAVAVSRWIAPVPTASLVPPALVAQEEEKLKLAA